MPKNQKLIFYLFLFTGLLPFAGKAQSSSAIRETPVPFLILQTSDDSLTIRQVMEPDITFYPLDSFPGRTQPQENYWIKADFGSLIPLIGQDSLWFFYTGNFDLATCFLQGVEGVFQKEYGRFTPISIKGEDHESTGVFFKGSDLIGGRFLFLKLKRYRYHQKINEFKCSLISAQDFNLKANYYSWDDFLFLTPRYLFIGAFVLIFIFTLILYLSSWRPDYLFYALYILCLLMYLGFSGFRIYEYLYRNYGLFGTGLHYQLQYFINLTYILFARYYLQTKINYPKLDFAIKVLSVFLIVSTVLDGIFVYNFYFEGQHSVINIHRLVMSFFAVLGVVYLFMYAKNLLVYFIIVGSLSFTAGSLGMLFTDNNNYMILGCTIELLLFGLGLSYKFKKDNEEKIMIKKEAFDNKLSALRAQMNPHFIFNSLSSIQHLISVNNKASALNYLTKFSRLMRNLLESSIETTVVLSEEIKTLDTYLELESLRFDGTFKYDIQVDDALDVDAVEVPALIVQPFVENAIIHGLLNKQGADKLLNIRFRQADKQLVCEVDDNGVGRDAASSEHSILKFSRKSRGIEVTEKRLQALSHENKKNVEIIDKKDDQGNALGTMVIIKIPLD